MDTMLSPAEARPLIERALADAPLTPQEALRLLIFMDPVSNGADFGRCAEQEVWDAVWRAARHAAEIGQPREPTR